MTRKFVLYSRTFTLFLIWKKM